MMYTRSLAALIAATVAMLLVGVEAAPISASPEITACIAECTTGHDKCLAELKFSPKTNKMVCDGLGKGCEFRCKHFPTKPPVVPVVPTPPTDPVVPDVPAPPTVPAP
ncbi:hypothetical protein BGX24_005514 [Mortierella sp. AD032]|nr:hypothetical protein BGX24_005514 [Mortierella sp. AD032]